ncbi:hypothetical protein [Nonomuraea glycinis]
MTEILFLALFAAVVTVLAWITGGFHLMYRRDPDGHGHRHRRED